MASQAADLLADALTLPARERAKIARELLYLDESTDGAAEAWVAELEQPAGTLIGADR